MKKSIYHLWAWALLPFIWQACDKMPDTAEAGESGEVIQIGYSLRQAPQTRTGDNDLEPFANETIFRFLGYVDKGADTYTDPSLTDHVGDEAHASPYGYYRYHERIDENDNDTIFEPCKIGPNMEYDGRDPSSAQKLTANNTDVTYKILAFTPPRPTKTTNGITNITYKRGEDLYLADAPFDIIIPSSTGKVYQVYRLPEPWMFRNMRSELVFSFYQKDVPFTLVNPVTLYGLGTDAHLHPYSKALKIFYHLPVDDTEEKKEEDNYLTDNFSLNDKGVAVGEEKTLRYSVDPISIFPADYTSNLVKYSIKVTIHIKYGTESTAEPLEISLPIKAQPSYRYLISFIVSRTNVEVRASVIDNWKHTLPEYPQKIGDSAGTVLLGKWNTGTESDWGNADLGGEDL